MIDAATIRAMNPCKDYTDDRLTELFDRPMTLAEVLTRKDGPWSAVPIVDRQWAFFRAATRDQINEALPRIVTRAITLHALACGIPAVEKWARKYLSGTDRTGESAWRAYHNGLAGARAAAEAEGAARAAEAEGERQIADMLAVIESNPTTTIHGDEAPA